MQSRNFLLSLIVSLSLAFTLVGHRALAADTADAALTGVVTSAEEGAMEGVLVSAKKERHHTSPITVVTERKGAIAFRAAKTRFRPVRDANSCGRLRPHGRVNCRSRRAQNGDARS